LTWNRIGIAASHSPAYIEGLLVVPVSTHRAPSSVRLRRPVGGLAYRAASSQGASKQTLVSNSRPAPGCCSSRSA